MTTDLWKCSRNVPKLRPFQKSLLIFLLPTNPKYLIKKKQTSAPHSTPFLPRPLPELAPDGAFAGGCFKRKPSIPAGQGVSCGHRKFPNEKGTSLKKISKLGRVSPKSYIHVMCLYIISSIYSLPSLKSGLTQRACWQQGARRRTLLKD